MGFLKKKPIFYYILFLNFEKHYYFMFTMAIKLKFKQNTYYLKIFSKSF